LGGTSDNDNRRNTFHDVDFTAADMRGSIYGAVEFLRCKFNHAKLVKVDFQSSAFTDCSFEGELRDVLFYRRGFDCERFPPNEMKRVDFRRARLRGSEFRGLDLDEVFFPQDEDHIVVKDYPQTLDRLLAYFGGRSDMGSQRLATRFEHEKQWLGPRQRVGVLSKHDLIASGGEEGLNTVMKIIGPAGRRP
jgi:Pentapeptide repeats (9 copies)